MRTIGHVLAGGDALDPDTPAGALLDDVAEVVVVPLAAAFARPEATSARVHAWAAARGVDAAIVPTVRRADSLEPAVAEQVASAAGVVVIDGAEAHLVSCLKRTPLLDALVAVAETAPVLWSGASAAAACDPMVDERGGAPALGLGVVDDVIVVNAWESWSDDARRRLRRLVPSGRLVVGIPCGSAIVPGDHGEGWLAVGPGVEAERDGDPVELS